MIGIIGMMFVISLNAWFEEYRASKAFENNNFSQSQQLLQQHLACHPDDYTAWYNVGYLHYCQKDFEKAYAYYEQAQKSSDQQLVQKARFNAGNAALQMKQWQHALEQFEAFLQEQPDHEQAQQSRDYAKKMLETPPEEQQPQTEDQKSDKNKDENNKKNDSQESKNNQADSEQQESNNNTDQSQQSSQNNSENQHNKRDQSNQGNNGTDQQSHHADRNHGDQQQGTQNKPEEKFNKDLAAEQQKEKAQSDKYHDRKTHHNNDPKQLDAQQHNASASRDQQDPLYQLEQQLDHYDASQSKRLFNLLKRDGIHEQKSSGHNW